MDFVLVFVKQYAALIIAALALWASWRANSHAKLALDQSKKTKLLEVQSEVLREIDLQHAKLGALLACTAEAALTYAQSEVLQRQDPAGRERISQNLNAVQRIRSRYDEQRRLAESSLGNGNIERQWEILANIRRLTLHVQEDIEKERRHLEQLQQRARTEPNK